jgi:hypothetical protein
MRKKEFIDFMDQQINEIEKYKQKKSAESPYCDSNTCVFEWINHNAEKFREEWYKNTK